MPKAGPPLAETELTTQFYFIILDIWTISHSRIKDSCSNPRQRAGLLPSAALRLQRIAGGQ